MPAENGNQQAKSLVQDPESINNKILSIVNTDWLKNKNLEEGDGKIFDFHSLVKAMLCLEYKREHRFIVNLLDNPETFIENFQQACKRRAEDSTNSFNFSLFADSPTNNLYLEIACLLFPDDPLAVLLPNVKNFFRTEVTNISFDEDSVYTRNNKNNLRNRLQEYTPPLIKSDRKTIPAKALPHCVISGMNLFDARSLSELKSIHFQRNFYNSLNARYPILTGCLYAHTEHLRFIKRKIDNLNEPQTPLAALKQLSEDLQRGGTQVTGKDDASLGAVRAFHYFKDYLQTLPATIRDELLSLDDNSLAKIIAHLDKGNCVEIAASKLDVFINANHSRKTLTIRHKTAEKGSIGQNRREFAQTLDDKALYKNFVGRDDTLPAELLNTILNTINLTDIEIVVLLLKQLPEELCKNVFAKINDEDTNLILGVINAINKKMFDNQPEKKQHILHQLARKIINLRIYNITNYVQRAPELFIPFLQEKGEALYNLQFQLELIKALYNKKELLKQLFDFLPQEKRRSFMLATMSPLLYSKKAIAIALSSFDFAAENIESFLNEATGQQSTQPITVGQLLNSDCSNLRNFVVNLPENERWPFIKNFCHARFRKASSSELAKILASLPQEDRRHAVEDLFADNKEELLNQACWSISLFNQLIPYLTCTECTNIAEQKLDYGTSVWQRLAKNKEAILTFVKKYPKSERWNLLTRFYTSTSMSHPERKNSIFHLIEQEALTDVIRLLPQEHWLSALKLESFTKGLVISRTIKDPLFVTELFSLCKDWQSLLSLYDGEEVRTVGELIINKPESLTALLKLVPPEERLQFLTEKDELGSRIIFKLGSHIDKLKPVFEELRPEDRSALIGFTDRDGKNLLHRSEYPSTVSFLQPFCTRMHLEQRDKNGDSPLHRFHLNPEIMQCLLEPWQTDERKALLSIKNHRNESALETAIEYAPSLKVILELIPQEERFSFLGEGVGTREAFSNTFWQKCLKNPESFAIALNSLPPTERFPALMLKNWLGNNTIGMLCSQQSHVLIFQHMYSLISPDHKNSFLTEFFALNAEQKLSTLRDNLKNILCQKVYGCSRYDGGNGINTFNNLNNKLSELGGEPLQCQVQILSEMIMLIEKNSTAKLDTTKRANWHNFIDSINNLPEVRKPVKILCIALAITIVGILPAAIIWSISSLSFFRQREALIQETISLDKDKQSRPQHTL